MTHINAKAMPINHTDYSCRCSLTNHIETIQRYITPLAINSLKGGDTHTQTHTHANRHLHRNNFKKPEAGLADMPGLKTETEFFTMSLIHYLFAPLILFLGSNMLDLLP